MRALIKGRARSKPALPYRVVLVSFFTETKGLRMEPERQRLSKLMDSLNLLLRLPKARIFDKRSTGRCDHSRAFIS